MRLLAVGTNVPLAQVWTTTKLASGIHFWCLTLEWWPRLFVGVDTLLPKCTKVQLLLLTSGRAPYVIPLFFSQLLFQACLLQLGASNLGPKKLCKLLGCYSSFSHLFLKPAFTFKGFQNGSHEPDKSSLLRWSLQATKRSISVRDPSLLFENDLMFIVRALVRHAR